MSWTKKSPSVPIANLTLAVGPPAGVSEASETKTAP